MTCRTLGRLEFEANWADIIEHGRKAKRSNRFDSDQRYAGRRLYNTVSLTYVTFDDLSQMILDGKRFIVRDAETGNDITRDILNRLH